MTEVPTSQSTCSSIGVGGERARGFWSNWIRVHGEYARRLPA